MKISEYVKNKGVKSLVLLSNKSGVPVTTLRDWYTTKRETFDNTIKGVMFESLMSDLHNIGSHWEYDVDGVKTIDIENVRDIFSKYNKL